MRLSIEDVSLGAKGVWSANVDPQRLLRLSTPIRQSGKLNVVLVSRPTHDANAKTLQFDLDSVILLNLGNTPETLLIDSREEEPTQRLPITVTVTPQTYSNGDRDFRKELGRVPESLRRLGEKLLDGVRAEYPGELVFHPTSKKFVESPDNFWVVVIQPRAQSLRVVVYGRPHDHLPKKTIELKQDMGSYSNFVINREEHLNDALAIIKAAKQLKDKK